MKQRPSVAVHARTTFLRDESPVRGVRVTVCVLVWLYYSSPEDITRDLRYTYVFRRVSVTYSPCSRSPRQGPPDFDLLSTVPDGNPLLHNEVLVDAQNSQKSWPFCDPRLKTPLTPAKGSCPTATDRCCWGRNPLAPVRVTNRC